MNLNEVGLSALPDVKLNTPDLVCNTHTPVSKFIKYNLCHITEDSWYISLQFNFHFTGGLNIKIQLVLKDHTRTAHYVVHKEMYT